MKPPTALIEHRLQLHYAIQGMAATGLALGTPQPDGSQMAFTWNPDLPGFMGMKIPGIHPIYVGLDPFNLVSLILDDQKQAIAATPLVNKTLLQLLGWHKNELAKLGFESEKITLIEYPADFPDTPLAHGAGFEVGDAAGRKAVADYFAYSQPILQDIVTAQAGASPLHIWPHHFDMATLITLAGTGAAAQTIGVGLSLGDDSYDQPYWYVTPWPSPSPTALLPLPVGNWHTGGWVGAVLRADEMAEPSSRSAQQTIRTFLESAVNACHSLLETLV